MNEDYYKLSAKESIHIKKEGQFDTMKFERFTYYM